MKERTSKILFYVVYLGLAFTFGIASMFIFGREWGFTIGAAIFVAIIALILLILRRRP